MKKNSNATNKTTINKSKPKQKEINKTDCKTKAKNQNNSYNECEDRGCNPITFSQQRAILKEINDKKYLNFFYFCCCTGVRVCEALTIKVADVDRKNKVIKIKLTDSKTKKHKREIPYLPELLNNMDLSNKYLFQDVTDEGSKQYFYKLYKKMNLELSRHSTRHTFVSMCAYVGIEPEVIQKWVGHTDIKMTTQTYTHNLNKGTSPILVYIRKLKSKTK